MKILLVGLGIQGLKRLNTITKYSFKSVDPIRKNSDYKSVYDVNLKDFKCAIVCTPEKEKFKIVKYLLSNKINVMVEKPLILNDRFLNQLKSICKKNNVIMYVCYNHRFEPFIIQIKNLIKKNFFGKIYSVKMFYGNGTASQVKKSSWKDKKNGVIDDLLSHLIDICEMMFNKKKIGKFKINKKFRFENKSPDYAQIINNNKNLLIFLEATYLMWKNTFILELIGKKGSIHMKNFCKWGGSELITRKRIYPHGLPKEKKFFIKEKDPTWKLELKHFVQQIRLNKNDFKKYSWVNNQLLGL